MSINLTCTGKISHMPVAAPKRAYVRKARVVAGPPMEAIVPPVHKKSPAKAVVPVQSLDIVASSPQAKTPVRSPQVKTPVKSSSSKSPVGSSKTPVKSPPKQVVAPKRQPVLHAPGTGEVLKTKRKYVRKQKRPEDSVPRSPVNLRIPLGDRLAAAEESSASLAE